MKKKLLKQNTFIPSRLAERREREVQKGERREKKGERREREGREKGDAES